MKAGYEICTDCKGNGFTRVPYNEAREEVHAQCQTCSSSGEVKIVDTDSLIKKIETLTFRNDKLHHHNEKIELDIIELRKDNKRLAAQFDESLKQFRNKGAV